MICKDKLKNIQSIKIQFNILLISIILLMSCIEAPVELECDNPMDPNCPNYESPKAEIISPSPADSSTITNNAVNIAWRGKQSSSTFKFTLNKLGENIAWSGWDSITTTSYNNLSDETSYTFYVKERYSTLDEQKTPTSRTFTVDYADPQATINQGPGEGSIITINYVIFSWYGVQPSSDFQYKLDGVDIVWSDWSTNKDITYSYLNEGSYIFNVKEKFDTGDEQEEITSRSFTVDAIIGPGLVMNKQLMQVAINDAFTVEIMVEEVVDLMGALIKIEFDQASIEVLDIEAGNFFNTNNPEGLAFIKNSTIEANEGGSIEINTSRLAGDPSGINGTGTIAKVIFMAKATTDMTEIYFSTENNCQMRDSNNGNIMINARIGTRVIINLE